MSQLTRQQVEKLFSESPISDVERALVSSWVQEHHPSQAAVQQVLLALYRDGRISAKQYWCELLTRVLELSSGHLTPLPNVELISAEACGLNVRNPWGENYADELREQRVI